MDIDQEQGLPINEASFKHIFENVAAGMALVSPEGIFLNINSFFCRMTGYDKDQLIGRNFEEITYREDLHIGSEIVNALLSEESETAHFEKRYVRANGEIFWARVTSFLARGDDGEPLYFAIQFTEITETKTLIGQLRETAWQLSKAQEMSKVGHWKLDAATLEVTGSDELFRIFGVGRDEANLDAFAAAVHPDDREYDLAHIRRGLEQGQSWDIEHRLLDREGKVKHVRAAGEATLKEDGQVESLFGTVQDISERKRVEEALRESEERVGAIVNNVADCVVTIDEESRIHSFNPAAERTFGYDKDEVIGKSVTILMEQPTRSQHELYFERYLRTGKARTIGTGAREITARHKEGSGVPLEIRVSEMTVDGRRMFVGAMRDITERKRAEEALRESEAQLAEAQNLANLGRWEWDLREGVNLCSAEKAAMLGLPPQACVLSEDDFLAFVHPDDREELRSRFARFLKDGQSYEMDYRIIRQDGKTCTLHERTKAVTDGQGRVTHIIGTVQDITERKRAEEQLRLALMDAEQANQAKSDFLATMSHELRTPLNAIIGFSDMIEGQFFGALGSEKYREYARDIQKSSKHLLALVNDILDLSAIEAGKQLPVKEDLIVKDVAADCTPIIANAASEKNIEFSVEVPDDLPPLCADRRAVKQILLNLLSNAVKYTPEDGKIMLKAKAANGIHTLEVSDTGMGVPAEKLSNLTDPFVRTESDPHKSHEGTGLGLAIVKSLVDLHGGELDINSDVGIGTTVTVTLPNEAR